MAMQRRDDLEKAGNGRFRVLEAGLDRLLRRPAHKDPSTSPEPTPPAGPFPACDVSETDDGYRIEVEVPAVSKQHLRITVDNGSLVVRGERLRSVEVANARSLLAECAYGAFERAFDLPRDADPTSIAASLANGMLVFTITKNPSSHHPPSREIQIT